MNEDLENTAEMSKHLKPDLYEKLMKIISESDLNSLDITATFSYVLGEFAFEHAPSKEQALKAVVAYTLLGIACAEFELNEEIQKLK